MTQMTRKSCTYWSPLYPGKSVLKSKGGNIWISNISKYLMTEITRMQTIFLVLKHPKNMHIKFLSSSEVTAGRIHDFISNWGKPFAHCSEMTVSTRDRLHNSSFFSNQHTHDQIDFALFINNGGMTWKTKWFQHNIYIFISISISSVCRSGHCTTFVKCHGWYTICWDNWGTKTTH